jgi:hypothetical protein
VNIDILQAQISEFERRVNRCLNAYLANPSPLTLDVYEAAFQHLEGLRLDEEEYWCHQADKI